MRGGLERQGDTTHTAIVGPDVNAAGLYVGLTRGRHHNTAIIMAHTRPAVTQQLANTMLRGLDETSITQSVNAVRDELGRSARQSQQAHALPVKEMRSWTAAETAPGPKPRLSV